MVDLNYQLPRLASDGLRFLGGHIALFVAGTTIDGPLQIEIVRADRMALRVFDWGSANSHQSVSMNSSSGTTRRIYNVGQTNLTNAQFADPSTGQGAALTLYLARPGYLSGRNSGLHYVRDLAWALGMPEDSGFLDLFGKMELYEQQPPLARQANLPLMLERVTSWGDSNKSVATVFDTYRPQMLAQNASANGTVGVYPLPTGGNVTANPMAPAVVSMNVPLNGTMDLYPDTADTLKDLIRLRQPLPHPWDHTVAPGQSPQLIHRRFDDMPKAPPSPWSLFQEEPIDATHPKDASGAPAPKDASGHASQGHKPSPVDFEVNLFGGVPEDPEAAMGGGRAPPEMELAPSAPSSRGINPSDIFVENYRANSWLKPPKPGAPDPYRIHRMNYEALAHNPYNVPALNSPTNPRVNEGPCRRGLQGRCIRPGQASIPVAEAAPAGPAPVTIAEAAPPKSAVMVRLNQVFQSVEIVEAARVVGAIGMAAAVAFIVLDFVNGNPVGGAFGLVGALLGVAAMALLEGPVGWIVAGFISLIAILPSLFTSHASDPPPLDNVSQMIQYVMFGDKDHTGNEKCREGTPEQPGNPNCTVVYGAGVLASTFKWDNFDSVAFMLAYNDGYPMSIPDMAAAFFVINSGINDADGTGKVATVTCNSQSICLDPRNCVSTENKCTTPTFAVKKNLITIPTFNQTGDVLYNRIIPNPGGDCKLVTDSGPFNYANYNLTTTGAPVAIACGLTPDLKPDGTSNLIKNATDIAPSNGTYPGSAGNGSLPSIPSFSTNSSTDGVGHTVSAPNPPVPFQSPLSSSNAVCLSGSGGAQCFPSGTYSTQSGSLGFESAKATNVTMPPGSWLAYKANDQYQGLGPGWVSTPPVNWTTNATSDTEAFQSVMSQQATIATDGTFDAHVSYSDANPDPPVLCLFKEPQWKGDAFCYGVGSGTLPDNMVNQAQSLVPHGNVEFWIYAGRYGDAGGLQFSAAVPDLSRVAYGNGASFNKNIKALWIIDPKHP